MNRLPFEKRRQIIHTPRRCLIKIAGAAAGAFLALGAIVDNLVKYLFGPGYFWLIGGSLLAGLWAYETFCREDV